MAANLAALMNASKASPTKLTGTRNYRTWAKDLELILVRMGCWEVTKNPPPPEAERTVEWTANNNWARSEIHLWCSPEQQQYIIDSELAFDSWNILASQHNCKSTVFYRTPAPIIVYYFPYITCLLYLLFLIKHVRTSG